MFQPELETLDRERLAAIAHRDLVARERRHVDARA